MKKNVPLSLTVMLSLIGVLSACSGNGGGQAESGTPSGSTAVSATSAATPSQYGDTGGLKLPLVDKPVTLTWMVASDNPNLNDNVFIKELEKRTGITLNIEAYPTAAYADKLKAVVAFGKLPDLFHGLPLSQINQLGDHGVVTPINKYLNELPNLKACMSTAKPTTG